MKVKEMIEALQNLPPSAEVVMPDMQSVVTIVLSQDSTMAYVSDMGSVNKVQLMRPL